MLYTTYVQVAFAANASLTPCDAPMLAAAASVMLNTNRHAHGDRFLPNSSMMIPRKVQRIAALLLMLTWLWAHPTTTVSAVQHLVGAACISLEEWCFQNLKSMHSGSGAEV